MRNWKQLKGRETENHLQNCKTESKKNVGEMTVNRDQEDDIITEEKKIRER